MSVVIDPGVKESMRISGTFDVRSSLGQVRFSGELFLTVGSDGELIVATREEVQGMFSRPWMLTVGGLRS